MTVERAREETDRLAVLLYGYNCILSHHWECCSRIGWNWVTWPAVGQCSMNYVSIMPSHSRQYSY